MSCGVWSANTAGPTVKLGARPRWPKEPRLACPGYSTVTHVAAPGSYNVGSMYAPKDSVMQLWQALGPWGPRRYPAFQYVAEKGYLPKDWDWAASPLNVGFPSLPHLVSSRMGNICDLISRGAPFLPRSAPNFGGAPMVHPDADSPLHVASNLANSPDRTKVRPEIRAPPATLKPPPPAHVPSDRGSVQTTDDPSDYQSDWYEDWSYSNWKWKGNRYRS